jgi:putative addiction module component (TIGR02574 family)
MRSEVAELLKDALSFSPEERAALANSLPESLDADVGADAEDAWRNEIRLRLDGIDKGEVSMIGWEDARRTLWTKLNH